MNVIDVIINGPVRKKLRRVALILNADLHIGIKKERESNTIHYS